MNSFWNHDEHSRRVFDFLFSSRNYKVEWKLIMHLSKAEETKKKNEMLANYYYNSLSAFNAWPIVQRIVTCFQEFREFLPL